MIWPGDTGLRVLIGGARHWRAAAPNSRQPRCGRGLRKAAAALGLLLIHALAAAQPPAGLPTLAELEAAGATIGEIRVAPQDIFDLADPREDKLLFRWANRLHIQTLPVVIERALLFKRGDKLSVRVIDETERLLRSNRYLYDVQIRPLAVRDGVVDLEVMTRDTWTLDPGISAGRSGGSNTGSIELKEYNLLGTGISLGVGRFKNADRTGTEFQVSDDRAFGTWFSVAASHTDNSDGKRDAFAVVRPFYALDARWSAGASASRDDRIDAVYQAGEIASEYRHRENRAELFAGRSAGLVNGWVQRTSAGLSLQEDTYLPEPGRIAPARMPADWKRNGPFVRYELVEDRFERELNRNLIGRPEFFALGLAATAQLGWAGRSLGSSRSGWLYALAASRGFEPDRDHTLMAAGSLAGDFGGGTHGARLGLQAQYYWRQSPRWLFYGALATDAVFNRPGPEHALLLGGDNGLRGYPLRYQMGTRRTLLTIEERFYTDIYLWRLFRIGGAAFVDVGRAWGGEFVNRGNPGWLGDAGFGLRIVSARSAFSNVLHVDLAFPTNATADIKKMQFLVKSRTSF